MGAALKLDKMHTISLRFSGAWLRMLKNIEYIGTVKNAANQSAMIACGGAETKYNSPHHTLGVRWYHGPSGLWVIEHV